MVPKFWLLNQVLCLLACAFLIFLNNMKLGIIMSGLAIVVVVVSDMYVHFREYKSTQGQQMGDKNFSI